MTCCVYEKLQLGIANNGMDNSIGSMAPGTKCFGDSHPRAWRPTWEIHAVCVKSHTHVPPNKQSFLRELLKLLSFRTECSCYVQVRCRPDVARVVWQPELVTWTGYVHDGSDVNFPPKPQHSPLRAPAGGDLLVTTREMNVAVSTLDGKASRVLLTHNSHTGSTQGASRSMSF